MIISVFIFAGPLPSLAPFITPFLALNPTIEPNVTVPYTDLASASGSGLDNEACQKFASIKCFPVGLLEYNVTAERKVYDLFKDLVTRHPDSNNSIVQHEGYPMEVVRKVDEGSTAYAHRGDNMLV